MPDNRITILEQQQLPSGALDGIKERQSGFVIRGGREIESHCECFSDPSGFEADSCCFTNLVDQRHGKLNTLIRVPLE